MIRLVLTALDGEERELVAPGPVIVRTERIELGKTGQIDSQVTTWELDGIRYAAIRIETPVRARLQSESADRDFGTLENVTFPDGTIAADGLQIAVRDDTGTRWIAADDHSAWDEFVVTER